MFNTELIHSKRGTFEVFVYGQGEPLVYTHLYSEYNAYGNLGFKFTGECDPEGELIYRYDLF